VPVSPTLAEDLAVTTVAAYAEAERSLLARIARAIARGLGAPGWAERQLFAVQSYRREAEQVLAELARTAARVVDEAVTTAANRGTAAAAAEVSVLLGRRIPDLLGELPGQSAVVRLVEEAVGQVTATHPRILRASVDAYRQVIADVSSRTLLGAETRRDTAQAALDRFARKGITGFVDRSGRGWSLESYAEMAVRTATAHAAVDAHSERLTSLGMDLVVVSDAPQECKLCRPWEGKILTLTGATVGVIEREHATDDGRMVRVPVAGSLAMARAAGLYHPGCRHSHSAYLPGITRPPTATADPEGDKARQRLRLLERRVRAARRLEAAALDDEAKRAARAKVRAAQAAIREHVATSSAKRQPARERLGAR
jgi:hypothetical protein